MLEGGKGIPFNTPPSIVHNRAHVDPGRICPGKYFALRTVYLTVTCILSVFDIGPVLDEDGNPRVPEIEFGDAFIRYVFLQLSIHTAVDIDRLATGIPSHSNVVSSLVLKTL